MGEIDDLYQERVEVIENEFFEDFKKNKDRKEIIDNYHKKLSTLIKDFEKKYSKQLSKEKDLLNNQKKKKDVGERYKTLQVTHLNFNDSSYDTFKMKMRFFFFKLGREYKKTIADETPIIVLYGFYKTRILIRRMINIIEDFFASVIVGIKNLTVSAFHILVHGIIESFNYMVKRTISIFSKISFKKNTEKKEEEKKTEGENAGEKPET